MKHNRIAAVILSVFTITSAASSESNILVTMHFSNEPISQVAHLYEKLTGSKVSLQDGMFCTFTFSSDDRLDREQALHLIESNLVAKGVNIEHTSEGIRLQPDPKRFRQEPAPVASSEAYTNRVILTSQVVRTKIVAPIQGDFLTPDEKLRHSPDKGAEAKGQQEGSEPSTQ